MIFVVEADEASRSDYMYIRAVLDKCYGVLSRKDINITAIFMGGKGNYNKPKILQSINSKIKMYNAVGSTYVIYCFDTDKIDSNPMDNKALLEEKKYCEDNGYDFVWFCHDVEEVFLGKSVKKKEKTNSARTFTANAKKDMIKPSKLMSKEYGKGKSNLMIVLKKYL